MGQHRNITFQCTSTLGVSTSSLFSHQSCRIKPWSSTMMASATLLSPRIHIDKRVTIRWCMMSTTFFCENSGWVSLLIGLTRVMSGQCKNRQLRDNIDNTRWNFYIHNSNTKTCQRLNLGNHTWYTSVIHVYMFMPADENGIVCGVDDRGYREMTWGHEYWQTGVFRTWSLFTKPSTLKH